MPLILVIDDDEFVRTYLIAILEKDGYSVVEASDGEEGLAFCRQSRVDLVITDLIMPVKEGFETIMALKSDFPDQKIIAITGAVTNISNNYLGIAGKFGADRVFEKPIDRAALLDAIDELLTGQPA